MAGYKKYGDFIRDPFPARKTHQKVSAPALAGPRSRPGPAGRTASVRLKPRHVKDLERQLAASRLKLAKAQDQIHLLREAVKVLRVQRDNAEFERSRMTLKFRSWRDTILGGVIVQLERVSRSAPVASAYFEAAVRRLGALVTGRLKDYREKRGLSQALLNEDRALILASGLFDARFYRAGNKDIDFDTIGVDPLDHYLIHGCREGREPNGFFNSMWYLSTYPEVEGSRRNPLAHYVSAGAAMGYAPSPAFDVSWYRQVNATELRNGMTVAQHYKTKPINHRPATEPAEAILRDTEAKR